MSSTELLALLPAIVLAATATLALAGIAWRRHATGTAILTAAGLLATMAAVPMAHGGGSTAVGSLLRTDGLFHFFTVVLAAASLACTAFAAGYFRKNGDSKRQLVPEELYVLLLLGTLGGVVLAGAVHLASLFLGLELLSVSLYGLIAYGRQGDSLEAGVKYLLLAAASSAFLVFGGALLYAASGSLELAKLGTAAAGQPLLTLGGGALLFVAIGFKLALVPFHLWTPDVYQGAPAPVTAFVASVSKAAVFALVIRWIGPHGAAVGGSSLLLGIAIAAGASMILGNFLALQQQNVKRLLAYSSIAHLGYLMVIVVAGGELAVSAGLYYALAYVVTILIAFGALGALATAEGEPQTIEACRGLFRRRPLLAAALTAALLSLAGIPLTGGFIGKLLVVAAGVETARWTLVLILALTSVVGLFYYLRVIVAMIGDPAGESGEVEGIALGRASGATTLALALLLVALFVLGVAPSALLQTVAGLVG